MSKITKTFNELLGFFFPIVCSGCGKNLPSDENYKICPECAAKIISSGEGLFCVKCGQHLPGGGAHCYNCIKEPSRNYEFIRSAAKYEGVLRTILRKFKYQNMDYLDDFLGGLLISAVKKYPEVLQADMLVSVPIHWYKRLTRGYNQSELLAKKVSEYAGKPLISSLFKRRHFTKPQFGLKKRERRQNLEGSFVFTEPNLIKGRSILIIDDICTTTATIDSCARALKLAGAQKVLALTVARD